MKLVVAVALVATSLPSLAVAMGRTENASNERRVCTQVTVRAGSRMSGRRICRTSSEWREALGPDWRQHLAGYTGLQDDYDALRVRAAPEDLHTGIQPQAGGIGARPVGAGPR
jgi:hypothetical protein